MAVTFNPLFDYKDIARNTLEGIGLDTKYFKEPLPDRMTLRSANVEGSPPKGITFRPVEYPVTEGAELIPNYVNGIAEAMVKRKKALTGTIDSYNSGDSGIVKANFATAATGVGMGVDILAETVGLGLKGLSIIITYKRYWALEEI